MRRISNLPAVVVLLAVILTGECHATGALFIRPLNSQQNFELMSIKSLDATVEIEDQIALTHVDQTFMNKSASRVESTFIFPLPPGAVITELVYWFNGKRYVASLREREAAQRDYDSKVRKLIDPALLQYTGENIFKLNIAPIDPNSAVRFEITYAELLPYDLGSIDYRMLLQTTGLSPDPLERVTVRVNAHTSRTFTQFTSPSHGNTAANTITRVADNQYTVVFGDENFIPTKDLVVRFETRRPGVDMNVLTYSPTPADSFGIDNFYALWITPPDSASLDATPRDLVFTADISSSMEGERIEQLRMALLAFVDGLKATDRFNIILFSTNSISFRPDLVDANTGQIEAARAFIMGMSAIGLTNIEEGLRASLAQSFTSGRNGIIVFLTDGYPTWGELKTRAIADSAAVRNGKRARIFPFGVGNDISRSLMEELATANGGYVTYISADDSIASSIARYFNRISLPVLTDLAVDYGGLDTYDRFAVKLPDLFGGTQVLQFGRYRGSGSYTVTLDGTLLDSHQTIRSRVDFPGAPGGNRAVARLWAKKKIDYLLGQITIYGEIPELKNAIIDLSIRFGILSPYTALYSDPTTGAPEEKVVPAHMAIEPNAPNPFSASTHIVLHLPPSAARARTTITIHDINGRIVRTLVDREMAPGRHDLIWDGTDESGAQVPSGRYICRVRNGGEDLSMVMVLQR